MSVLPTLQPMPPAALEKVEAEIARLLDGQASEHLRVLGYGEISVAVAYPAQAPQWACKRLPPFESAARAAHYAQQVTQYQEQLTSAGVAVVPTTLHTVTTREGRVALYLVQAVYSSHVLAVPIWRQQPPRLTNPLLQSILRQLLSATSPHLAMDAQLANWVWDGQQALQFDISTPFMRDANGHNMLDTRLVAQPYPPLLRPMLRRWVVPGVLAKYHSRRGVMSDFAGNLIKEGLSDWLPVVLQAFNAHLAADPAGPLTEREVQAHYARDARLWECMYWLKRSARWWSRSIRCSTYPYLLSPPIPRYQESRHA